MSDNVIDICLEAPKSCAPSGGLAAVACLRTSSELAAFSGEWRELYQRIGCQNAFLSVEWMASWWRHWGGRHRLFVVTVREMSGRLIAIAPFYIRRSGFGPGRPCALCFLAHKWVGSDHLNVIVDPKHEHLGVDAIVRFVEQQRAEWAYIELAAGEETSRIFARLCQGFKSLGMTERVTDSEVCPYTTLPSSFEEYLAGVGGSLRYNFRRRRRALEREGQFKFIVLRSGAELQEGFGKLVRLHRLRFEQQHKYSSFLAPHILEFHADSLEQMAAAGMVRLFLLQIGDEPVAALYGFSANKTFSFYQIGMDPAWARLSVGLVMIGCSIEEAIRTGHERFDFLRGDEAYKFQWARDTRPDVTRYLFDRRIRSQWSWPEVWVKREMSGLIRGCIGMMEGLLFPHKTVEHFINVVRKFREQPPPNA